MLKTNLTILQKALEELQQATLDHAVWHEHLLRVISGRQPCDPNDLAMDAHRRCQFGRWYFERALPELRQLPSFAMIGVEHENQHRIAAMLLRGQMAGAAVERMTVDEFEVASGRLSYALYFIRREIECALHSRDALTDAHNAGAMVRDLREWHALAKVPGRQCCIALMELDDAGDIGAIHSDSASAQALVTAVKIVAEHLRLSDKVFRFDSSKFLIRLSATDLARGRTVIMRLREALVQRLTSVGEDGVVVHVTTSFGIAMLDPDVDAMESVDRADQALTLAKAAGRNRMIIWDPSVTTGVRLRRLEMKDVQS